MITDGPLFASPASFMVVIFNTTIPVENISTPLIFFSPHLAYQLNVATYLHVGSTGVRPSCSPISSYLIDLRFIGFDMGCG